MTDKELLDSAQRFANRWDVSPKQAADIGTALEFIDELIDALRAHQWRPIETAPSKGKILLAYMNSRDTEGERPVQVVDAGITLVMKTTEATHWKPLTPPEVEK